MVDELRTYMIRHSPMANWSLVDSQVLCRWDSHYNNNSNSKIPPKIKSDTQKATAINIAS